MDKIPIRWHASLVIGSGRAQREVASGRGRRRRRSVRGEERGIVWDGVVVFLPFVIFKICKFCFLFVGYLY